MPRVRGKTAARGYGGRYQADLAAWIARWRPGDPCVLCHLPMWQRWTTTRTGRKVSAIELDHTPDRAGYRGLAHAHCNRSDGARRGNSMRGQRRAAAKAAGTRPQTASPGPLRTSRQW